MITDTTSFRVEIETPKSDELKTFTYHRRTIILDDGGAEVGFTQQQPEPLKFRLADVAEDTRTVFDPILGHDVTISIAGLARVIEADFIARGGTTTSVSD